MKYAFADIRSRFTEPTAARARGRIQTLRRPIAFGASAKRSKQEKLLTPRNYAACLQRGLPKVDSGENR